MKSMQKITVHIDLDVPVRALERLGANRQLILADYNHATGMVTYRDVADGRNLGMRLMSLQHSLEHINAEPLFTEREDRLIEKAVLAIA